MPKKIPMRTCIGCGACRDKNMLIRVVRPPEGGLLLDPSGRANGRGAYLCRTPECLEKALKRKALTRVFHTEVSREAAERITQELRDYLKEGTG